MINDFFEWNMRQRRTSDNRPALTESQLDELTTLFDEAGLPETSMNAEMADGYLTGCIVGPESPPVHEWLERIFGQPALPICQNPQQQERLLALLLQRHWDIQQAFLRGREATTRDNLYLPLMCEVATEDRIQPYQLDANGNRLGAWDLKDWAVGFHLALRDDDLWEAIFDDKDATTLLSPFILFQKGYNPDNLATQIDHDDELMALLIGCLYQLRDYWRHARRAQWSDTLPPFVRDTPKVGRNDPCTCGSGKKFKKCCGAH